MVRALDNLGKAIESFIECKNKIIGPYSNRENYTTLSTNKGVLSHFFILGVVGTIYLLANVLPVSGMISTYLMCGAGVLGGMQGGTLLLDHFLTSRHRAYKLQVDLNNCDEAENN